ncbi:AAA ATPase forming ring-shaped complexes-like [Frankliniella occidentalis]|uniref:AAA ATPase forming ring-shaped complexes-like n=1 Tax=Frankliniella occidentalis TaxID=133901 RepID=A0A9C6XR82_FRAOC|nr:AAA ATPase forming ring-shaped complexes-like [Frankliniella occidentalis]
MKNHSLVDPASELAKELVRQDQERLLPSFRFLRESTFNTQLLYHNIQSLPKHLKLVVNDEVFTKSDVLLFGETWTLPEDDIHLPGFAVASRIDCLALPRTYQQLMIGDFNRNIQLSNMRKTMDGYANIANLTVHDGDFTTTKNHIKIDLVPSNFDLHSGAYHSLTSHHKPLWISSRMGDRALSPIAKKMSREERIVDNGQNNNGTEPAELAGAAVVDDGALPAGIEEVKPTSHQHVDFDFSMMMEDGLHESILNITVDLNVGEQAGNGDGLAVASCSKEVGEGVSSCSRQQALLDKQAPSCNRQPRARPPAHTAPLVSPAASRTSNRTSSLAFARVMFHNSDLDEKMVNKVLSLIRQLGTVHWNDVCGLSSVKQRLKEMVVYPLLNPTLFQGLRRPGRGLLLFGPLGNRKTLIGKVL